jgi:uncharacterized protein (DUF952 family)
VLIFKIVPRAEWDAAAQRYEGSAHDRADGFLHFSTKAQLPETLRRYYAGRSDLLLIGVEAEALGDALKWDYAPARGEDFPHLYGALPLAAVRSVEPVSADGTGGI